MASPSKSRPAEPRHRRNRGLLVAAGMGQIAALLAACPVQAQESTGSAPEGQVQDAPQSAPAPAEPGPVPSSLDELIPADALADPEGWAQRGGGARDAGQQSAGAGMDEAFLPPPPEVLQPALDAAFADFALAVPEPLAPDPELETLPSLAGPVLGELPALEEVAIGDALVLGLPRAPEAFPERQAFIARFRELSRLRQFDDAADAAPQIAARARVDAELLGELLRTYGYYSGEVVRQLSGGRRARGGDGESAAESASAPRVRFDVLPGPRYRFGRIDLGPLSRMTGAEAERLIAAFAIRPGDPLYADAILARELELRVALGESGFPFAELGEPELLIDHARQEGDLRLAVNPGGTYAFGAVASGDPAFLSSRHLARIARFAPGDLYRHSLVTDLRRAIIATGLVSSVTITPRPLTPPADTAPGEVVLDVDFERAPVRTIAGAIGYGSEDGFKIEGRWEHRNLFPPEGALRLRGILGTREALGSLGVRRNNFRGRDQILTADLYASAIETLAVDSRSLGLRTTFEKVSNILFQKPVSWQLGGELLYSDERNRLARNATIILPRQTYLIAGMFGSLTLDGSDDLLNPTQGYRASLFLAPELSRSRGEESLYLRAQADAASYASLGSTVLAARLRAATIQGAERDKLAPSRRLYAGGGGSVRGYGFQGIGPRNERGEPIGGASLVEVSLEARIDTPLLDGAIAFVPFFDAGTVAPGSIPDFRQVQLGAGLGIRYKTSFGPIRVDLATPLNPTAFDSPVVVYVSLGQAF